MGGVIVSVVITTHNRPDFLKSCLSALVAQDLPKSQFEVLVVDSYSRNPERNKEIVELIAADNGLNVKYHLNKIVGGSTKSKNLAVSLCSTNYIVYVDDDSIPGESFVKEALKALKKPGVDLVVGRMLPKYIEVPKKSLEESLKTAYKNGYYITDFTVIDLGEDEIFVPWNLAFSSISAFKKDFYLDAGGSGPDGFSSPYLFWNGSGEHNYSYKAKKILYAPKMISKHIISKERLTHKYFRTRSFFYGIGESFELVRTNKIGWVYFFKLNIRFLSMLIQITKKVVVFNFFNALRDISYMRGFWLHQFYVFKYPELRKYCKLSTWFDYDFKKIFPIGSSKANSQWTILNKD